MSENNGPTPGGEKAAKIKKQSEREPVLKSTFASVPHDTYDHEGNGRHPPGSRLLQRQCACGQHTIAGEECDTCRQQRENSFLQRTAINVIPDNAILSNPAKTHIFPKLGYAQDFSQIPVHTNVKKTLL